MPALHCLAQLHGLWNNILTVWTQPVQSHPSIRITQAWNAGWRQQPAPAAMLWLSAGLIDDVCHLARAARTMEPVREEERVFCIVGEGLSSLAPLCEHQQRALQPVGPQLAAMVMPQICP